MDAHRLARDAEPLRARAQRQTVAEAQLRDLLDPRRQTRHALDERAQLHGILAPRIIERRQLLGGALEQEPHDPSLPRHVVVLEPAREVRLRARELRGLTRSQCFQRRQHATRMPHRTDIDAHLDTSQRAAPKKSPGMPRGSYPYDAPIIWVTAAPHPPTSVRFFRVLSGSCARLRPRQARRRAARHGPVFWAGRDRGVE